MLTTVEIRSIKPAARPFKVRDDKGLFLLVQPSGALLWRFRYKAFGVERKLSLGSFPDVTLKEAREKRDAARAQLIDGVDPVAEKRQRRIEAELAAKTTFMLVAAGVVTRSIAIDSTYIKAQRAAFGAKRGRQIQAICSRAGEGGCHSAEERGADALDGCRSQGGA